MSKSGPVTVELERHELDWIRPKLAAEVLTYISHDVTGGLFPHEKERMLLLQAFHKKLEKL